jgi:hypothetical protein
MFMRPACDAGSYLGELRHVSAFHGRALVHQSAHVGIVCPDSVSDLLVGTESFAEHLSRHCAPLFLQQWIFIPGGSVTGCGYAEKATSCAIRSIRRHSLAVTRD